MKLSIWKVVVAAILLNVMIWFAGTIVLCFLWKLEYPGVTLDAALVWVFAILMFFVMLTYYTAARAVRKTIVVYVAKRKGN